MVGNIHLKWVSVEEIFSDANKPVLFHSDTPKDELSENIVVSLKEKISKSSALLERYCSASCFQMRGY